MGYDKRDRRSKIRLRPDDIEHHAALLTKIMKLPTQERSRKRFEEL